MLDCVFRVPIPENFRKKDNSRDFFVLFRKMYTENPKCCGFSWLNDSWLPRKWGNLRSWFIFLSLLDATGWETFSCIDQSCPSQRSRAVILRVHLQSISIHKLHVFEQLGLMIEKDYQGKNVQVLEKIQSRNKCYKPKNLFLNCWYLFCWRHDY